jgi:polyferredoxin
MATAGQPAPTAAAKPATSRTNKPLIRRTGRDRSQIIRHSVQGAFVVLNAWLGLQFFLWVHFYENGGTGIEVARPAGAEGWLPIAGLMNLKYALTTGKFPPVHPAAMFLFASFLLMSVLLKKAFCSWLCPVGTFSEMLGAIGRKIFGRNFHLHKWVDIPLRSLKYILLGLFAGVIGAMSAEALLGFMQTPYGMLADVKMLNFFRHMGPVAMIVIAALVGLSMLVQNFWCRYLCPYGALLGLASLLSPVKIRRDASACIDCAKCAKACPAALKVDQLVQIRSVECSACLQCVAACPAENALQFALPPRKALTPKLRWARRAFGPVAVSLGIAYLFFGVVLYARATNHWKADQPREVYMELVPRASELSHPGME